MVDRVGRRPLWLISTSACLVGFSIVAALSATFDRTGSQAAGGATVAFLFLFYLSYDLGWTPLACTFFSRLYSIAIATSRRLADLSAPSVAYSVEILPFSIRAKGMTLMAVTQAVAQVFNQWVRLSICLAATLPLTRPSLSARQVNPVALEAIGWRYYLC